MNARRTGAMAAAYAGVYAILTLAYTWPLPLHLTTGVAHDLGDPLLNTWILWWSGTQAIPLTSNWWNAPAFFPATGVLAFSEHLLGLAPVAAPLIAIAHKPLLGYNVALMATFVASALGAHFLAYTITRRHDASFIAAVAFAFAPYRLAQVSHIQVLSSFWTPVCLAALHRYTASPRPVWAALAAVAWLLQALTCGYYLFFSSVLLVLWLLWFAAGRWSFRQFAIAGGGFVAAGVLLVPILSRYQAILQDTYGFARGLDEIQSFSADVAGLLLATRELLVWGWVHVIDRLESTLFPGVTIVLLTCVALARARPFASDAHDGGPQRTLRLVFATAFLVLLVAAAVPVVYGTWRVTIGRVRVLSISRADKPLTLAFVSALALLYLQPRVRAAIRVRSPLAFYALAALAMWVCALGPDPTFMNRPIMYQAPYGWLIHVPGFDGLRVPARFWMMSLACLSVVAAIAVDRSREGSRRLVIAAAATGLLIDGWPRRFPVIPAPELHPSPPGTVVRLELPISDDIDAQALYQQTSDRLPLYNGFSGYFAPHYYALQVLIAAHDPRILHALAAVGAVGVVIDHAGDPDGALRRFVLAYPEASQERSEATWSSYRLERSTAAVPIPDRIGTPLAVKSLSTFPNALHAGRALDGNLVTRWSGGVQQQSAEATIELQQTTRVGQVVIDLGGYITDFPQRLKIDVSADGGSWETAWVGETALHAYYGAVRHPREMPLVFALNRDNVRFIRLTQIGFGTHDWSIPELHVLQ
jgi:hypothetical protein